MQLSLLLTYFLDRFLKIITSNGSYGVSVSNHNLVDLFLKFVLNVTYAMKTSIAGIFFSLILTVLNTLFPIKETRLRVFKKVETSLQMLWYHIHTANKKENSQEVVFEKLLSVLDKLESKLSGEEIEEVKEEFRKVR